jgi:hypothetical protein
MRKTLEKLNINFHIKVYFFGEFEEFLDKNPKYLASIFYRLIIFIYFVVFQKYPHLSNLDLKKTLSCTKFSTLG